jgi:RNA polymerase sigma-70 factor (ECF subfamily)
MQRYAAGEDTAFGELYRVLAQPLFRFCMRLARQHEEASEVFQDALLRLHRVRSSYIPGSPVLGWAFAIARSAYLDRLRRRRRRPEATVDLETACAHGTLRGASCTPEADLRACELQVVVDRELERMSERNRKAYVLRERDDLSVMEVAAALGTSHEAAKQRSHRAQEQIRDAVRHAGW